MVRLSRASLRQIANSAEIADTPFPVSSFPASGVSLDRQNPKQRNKMNFPNQLLLDAEIAKARLREAWEPAKETDRD
jgi:hypothetical protein